MTIYESDKAFDRLVENPAAYFDSVRREADAQIKTDSGASKVVLETRRLNLVMKYGKKQRRTKKQ